MAVPALIQFDKRIEYGLRLPDGEVLWPPQPFYGAEYQTPEGRGLILSTIRDFLSQAHLPVPGTLDGYKWLVREHQVITTQHELLTEAHDLDDPSLVEEPSEESNQSPEVV